jgi:hypothetical protein
LGYNYAKITVELVPHGREEASEILKTLEIFNDGTGTKTNGNYGYRYLDINRVPRDTGEIKNHPRLDVSVWNLVWKVLNERYGSKKT